ncbi:MAG: TrkH family potassium uptake protein [Spirochaetes bacterium]|uniref:TrkH family potassium uptake protein n=1 Tax=Candidatus Aphodenecus pullistercoris TaxID=2840669 RepID=A0A9D9HBQ0_9SPIR|nr:TrkH family potassium uptake protein [Candidatus Aphodenecus pullistercoris]
MHPKSVIRLLSFITVFMAAILLIPLLVSLGYGEAEGVDAFARTIILMVFISLVGIILTHGCEMKVSVKDSYLFVTLTWVVLTFFGALPMQFTHVLDNFAQCYFEIMSGFTTTGAAAMVGIDDKLKGILFWRNMTNWLGGMGIVVLFIAILPALGVSGTPLYGAESVGPTKDKLRPKIKETAIILWGIYTGISAIQVVLLMLGGLDWFDAVTVMFGTMGAAGYVPHDASIAYYQSPYVEWVCTIFMFMAGTNFALYFRILQRKFSKVFRDGEYRLYWKIVLISTALVAGNLFISGIYNLSDSIRQAAFQVVSFITTTGFSSTNYTLWPTFAQAVLYVMMFIGGCAGSTGGGIKVVRIGAMSQLFRNSITKRLHPNAVTVLRLGDETFSNDTLQAIAGFVGFYITNAIIGTLVLSLTEADFLVVHTSVLLTLGNIGIGLGGIGTDFTFAIYPQWALWCFSFLMLVGRLELFTVYSIFTRDFWRR